MSLCVFDKGRGRLLILLLASILQSTLAASQELPDAPSAVMRTSFYAAGDSANSADPRQSSAGVSADSSRDKFLTRWVKRGLRDQADTYTAPLHRSELKWVIGLPVVTAGLIAISMFRARFRETLRTRVLTSPTWDCSRPLVRLECFSSTESPKEILMPSKPACLEPRRWQTAASCMPCCSSLRSVNVLYKERVKNIFFRPAAWIIPFPPALRSSRGPRPAQLRTNTQSPG